MNVVYLWGHHGAGGSITECSFAFGWLIAFSRVELSVGCCTSSVCS